MAADSSAAERLDVFRGNLAPHVDGPVHFRSDRQRFLMDFSELVTHAA